jgi:hypothetical protein
MTAQDYGLTRRMWHQLEPVHAVFWYAPEVFEEAAGLGYDVTTVVNYGNGSNRTPLSLRADPRAHLGPALTDLREAAKRPLTWPEVTHRLPRHPLTATERRGCNEATVGCRHSTLGSLLGAAGRGREVLARSGAAEPVARGRTER